MGSSVFIMEVKVQLPTGSKFIQWKTSGGVEIVNWIDIDGNPMETITRPANCNKIVASELEFFGTLSEAVETLSRIHPEITKHSSLAKEIFSALPPEEDGSDESDNVDSLRENE